MINRQTYALKPRGGSYRDMLEKCPMTDCNGKPKEMTRYSSRRRYECDKCDNQFRVSYIPYLRRMTNND